MKWKKILGWTIMIVLCETLCFLVCVREFQSWRLAAAMQLGAAGIALLVGAAIFLIQEDGDDG